MKWIKERKKHIMRQYIRKQKLRKIEIMGERGWRNECKETDTNKETEKQWLKYIKTEKITQETYKHSKV